MLSSIGAVLGIDVGCSAVRRSSAICRIAWSTHEVTWEVARFRAIEPERTETIVAVAGGLPIACAAFDGPLRRGFDGIGRYRTAERMLTRRFNRKIGKPGASSAPVGRLLNAHANACASDGPAALRCRDRQPRHADRRQGRGRSVSQRLSRA